MKIYNVEYNPEENEGIYALSVVKNPAMQSNWITLSENNKMQLATVDEERRILMGIALIPNKPIYRNDRSGEYNIVFSSKTIEKAAHDFVKKGNVNNSTLEHEIDLGSDAVSVVESWIIEDETHDKSRKFGFSEPVGSWAVMMKVHDDETWNKAKSGEIQGFSIDAFFNLKEITKQVNMSENKESNLLQRLGKALLNLSVESEDVTPSEPKEDVKLGEVTTTDGVTIKFDGENLEVGATAFIENEGERVPLPIGDYKLEDDNVLVIVEEGIVGEVKPMQAEEPQEEPAVEMSDEEVSAMLEQLEKHFGFSEIKKQVEDMKVSLTAIQAENESLKVKLAEYGKQPATEKVNLKKEVQPVDLSGIKSKARRLYLSLNNN